MANSPSNPFSMNKPFSFLKNEKNAIILLIAMHVAGIVGLALPATRELFKLLVPFNLLANAVLILLFHKEWNKNFLIALGFVMLTGFGVEVAGVHTKVIFGNYWYKTTLGIKVFDVPLLIAVNWLIVIYTTSALVAEFQITKPLKAILASVLTVGLDYLIEPIAIRYDFWDWAGGVVPLQNYLGWFCTALVLHFVFVYLPFQKNNKVAVALYVYEVLFFVILKSFS
jgi:putative membrane protein